LNGGAKSLQDGHRGGHVQNGIPWASVVWILSGCVANSNSEYLGALIDWPEQSELSQRSVYELKKASNSKFYPSGMLVEVCKETRYLLAKMSCIEWWHRFSFISELKRLRVLGETRTRPVRHEDFWAHCKHHEFSYTANKR
jgi:hypothetical protein